jgi:DNA-binding IclR family transcriptional regulator
MSKIVARTLDFLELFADQKKPLSLSEIARLLRIPASSCHDVLRAMQERGYIYELSPRGGYYPTVKIFEIAKTITDFDPVPLRADILLRALRDKLDESVLLSKGTGLGALYLLSFEPSHPLRFQIGVGDAVRSLYATSAGKALLGSLTDSELDAFLASAPLERITPATITSPAALREEIAAGNRRGWHLNREESQPGVTTLSARFLWTSTVYIVTIAGPSSRLDPHLEMAAASLVEVCRQLAGQNP